MALVAAVGVPSSESPAKTTARTPRKTSSSLCHRTSSSGEPSNVVIHASSPVLRPSTTISLDPTAILEGNAMDSTSARSSPFSFRSHAARNVAKSENLISVNHFASPPKLSAARQTSKRYVVNSLPAESVCRFAPATRAVREERGPRPRSPEAAISQQEADRC